MPICGHQHPLVDPVNLCVAGGNDCDVFNGGIVANSMVKNTPYKKRKRVRARSSFSDTLQSDASLFISTVVSLSIYKICTLLFHIHNLHMMVLQMHYLGPSDE